MWKKNVDKLDKIKRDFLNGSATLPQQVCTALAHISICLLGIYFSRASSFGEGSC